MFKVDKSICIGCGACAATAPDIYDIEDDGLATVVKQPEKEQVEEAKEALESCPVDAISEEK